MSVVSIEKDLTNLGCYRHPSHFIPLKPPNESDHCFNHISYLAGLTHTIGTPNQRERLDTGQPMITTLGKFAARLVGLEVTTVLAQKEKEKLFHPKHLSSRPWLRWHIACSAAEPTLLASIKGTVVDDANFPSPIIITDGGKMLPSSRAQAILWSLGLPAERSSVFFLVALEFQIAKPTLTRNELSIQAPMSYRSEIWEE